MHVSNRAGRTAAWRTAALAVGLAALGILHFSGVGTKWMALLAGFGVIALFVFGDTARLWKAPALALLGYALWSWVTVFWAMSGKFHLREGSKILIAVFFFLLAALRKKPDGAFAQRVLGLIAGISALCAFMSVEAVSTGFFKTLLGRIPGFNAEQIEFTGSRLYGIFGNSNIEASVYAIGIFCAIALICGAEKRGARALWTAALSVSAFAFLLAFSMGAMACFAAAVTVYLICAGKRRGAALPRMLGAALPTLACGFLAAALLGGERSALAALLIPANAGVSIALELTVNARLAAALVKHERLAFGALLAVVLGAGVYAAAALTVTGPYTFGAEIIRSAQLDAGEHTVEVEADGAVRVYVYAQNAVQMMGSNASVLYDGLAEETVLIDVPEDAKTFFSLSAEDGVTVRSVRIDGAQELPLRYKLLPAFAAARVQSFGMNNSEIGRALFRQDAIKLWKLSPLVGSGVGSFETGVSSVQDFPYETRYVHNHYLQILLEDGVIGLALYVGALAAMAAALWKKRKQAAESEFCWIYPALCAEFVMNGAQMMWDVSMSMAVFVCMTYALYGLIVGVFAEPLHSKKAEAEDAAKPKKKQQSKKAPGAAQLLRYGGAAVSAVIVLTMCGNLYAQAKTDAPVASTEDFLANLETAARVDLYEHNDAMLSYMMGSLSTEHPEDFRAQADAYAQRLAAVQSNTIPYYLVSYYVQTERFDRAVDAAILGASYSASNAAAWDDCCLILYYTLIDTDESPLLTQRETLMPKLMEYYDALQAHNAAALTPLAVSDLTQTFFDKVAALNACMDDEARFIETLQAA